MKTCYFNGQYTSVDNAKVSVFDRGFLFSDGVYEVIPVYNLMPFLIHEHIKRLKAGLQSLEIQYDCQNIYQICMELIERNSPAEPFYIYIQISRGEQQKRDHRFIDIIGPTVYIGLSKCDYPRHYDQSHNALLAEDIRWQNCSIKSISLLPNVLYKQQAYKQRCLEIIMHKNNVITEASSSNVWIVKNKQVLTPPATSNILNGITRVFLIDVLKKHGVEINELEFTTDDLLSADEVWVTSSTKEIQPIVSVQNTKIGNGQIGGVYKQAVTAFNKEKQLYYDAKKYL